MPKTVPCFFYRFTGWLGVLVLSCMDGCAPASNPCGSMVASAENHWPIHDHASYGGQIVWNNAEGERHCTAAFQASTAESSLRSVSAFHCMRNLVLDYMVYRQNPPHGEKGEEDSFPIYIALSVAHVEGSICRNEESAEKLAHVRIPVDFKEVPFLVNLEKKYQAIYAGLPPNQQASGEWVKVIKNREKKWIENFYDERTADNFKTTAGGDGEEDGESIQAKYDHLACATQHFDDPRRGEYKDYFASLESEHSKLHVMCFLHSDVAIVDIEVSSNLQFEIEDKACLQHAMLNFGTGKPLWELHKDSEPWLQAQLDLREASLSSTMSKDDASLRHIDVLSKSDLYDYYREKASPFVNDKEMVYGYGPGLTLFAEFKTRREENFSFSELFLSSISQSQRSTHRKQYVLGQNIPVVFPKNWGMIALYRSSMEVLTGSSGSLVAYKNNILSVLHSVNGKEYWAAGSPAAGTTKQIATKVDHHEDNPPASSDQTQSSDKPNSYLPPPNNSSPPSSKTPPSSSSPPTDNSPPENIGVPNDHPSNPPGPDSSESERVADTETKPSSQQQPSQDSEHVSTGQPPPSVPSGSHDQQQNTTTNPCTP